MDTFYLNYFLESAAFLTGLLLYTKLQPARFRLLVLLLFLTVVNEGIAYYGVYAHLHVKKTLVYAIFFIIECSILWRMFAFKQNPHRLWIYNSIFLLALVLQLFFLFQYGYKKMNPAFLNVVCGYTIFLGISYYYKLYIEEKYVDITKDPYFWLATGIIIVNFVHLFYVNAVLLNVFQNDPNRFKIFKNLNTIGNIIYYPLLIKALLCSSKLQKQGTT